jgi:hypothetical protein
MLRIRSGRISLQVLSREIIFLQINMSLRFARSHELSALVRFRNQYLFSSKSPTTELGTMIFFFDDANRAISSILTMIAANLALIPNLPCPRKNDIYASGKSRVIETRLFSQFHDSLDCSRSNNPHGPCGTSDQINLVHR